MKDAMKIITTSLLISNVVITLIACTTKNELDSVNPNEKSGAASAWIGSSGGVLSVEDSSAYLSVPMDSIAQETELSLEYIELQEKLADHGLIPMGNAVQLNPHHTHFDGTAAPRLYPYL